MKRNKGWKIVLRQFYKWLFLYLLSLIQYGTRANGGTEEKLKQFHNSFL